jgi:hypothetical protein
MALKLDSFASNQFEVSPSISKRLIKMKTISIKTILGLTVIGWGIAFNDASAQSLISYFDFTKEGSAASGSTVQSQYGSMLGTLNSSGTSLTSSGLTVTGTDAGGTGLRLANGSLAPFVGDFTIQMWYKNSAVNQNGALFGGTSGTTENSNLSGDSALFVSYNSSYAVRPVTSNGSQYGSVTPTPASNTGNSTGTALDIVLTYVASSKTLTEYVNGVQVGTGALTGFTGLSSIVNFSIAGISNPAFGDSANPETTLSFLLYMGALSSSQVSSLNSYGASPTIAQVQSDGIVAWSEGSNALDRVDFGNLASETAHSFDVGFNPIPIAGVGALGQTYRAPLTSGTGSTSGQLSVRLKVDPNLQNYVTVRMWGSDSYNISVDFTGDSIYDNLDLGSNPTDFPNRFYYSTLPIPLSMTQGQTSLQLVLYENGVSGAAGRPIYSAYTHTDPHFIPAGANPTGTQPTLTGQIAPSSALTLSQVCSLLEENRQNIYQNIGSASNPSDAYDQILNRQIPAGQAGAPPETIGLDLHTNVASWAAANPSATPDQWRDQCGAGQYGPGYSTVPDEMLSVLTSTYLLPQFTDQNANVVVGLDHYHDATIIPRIVSCLDGCTYLQGSDGHYQNQPYNCWGGLTSTPRATGHAYAGSTSRGPGWSISLEGADTETLGRVIVQLLNDPTAAPIFKSYLTQTGNYDLTGTNMPRYQAYERMLNNTAYYLYSDYSTGTVAQGLMAIDGMYSCELALTKLQALYPYGGGAYSTFPNDSYSYTISYPALTPATAVSYLQQITGAVAATNLNNLYQAGTTNYGISVGGFGEAHGSISCGYDGRYGTIEPWEAANLVAMAALDPAVNSTVLNSLKNQAQKAVNGFLHFISTEENYDGIIDQFTLAQEDYITYRDTYQPNADCRDFFVGCGYLASDSAIGINSAFQKRGAYLEGLYGVLPLSEGNKGGGDSLEYLAAMGSYEATMRGLVNVNPSTLTPLPGEPGQPNSAFIDPVTGTTAIYCNGERLYMNNNWHNFEFNNNTYGKVSELARIHDTTSTVDQDTMVYLPYNASTVQSDGNYSGALSQPWVMRYGNWLVAGNPTSTGSSLKLPAGSGQALDLVSNSKYSLGSIITVPAGGSVALNMPVTTTAQLLGNGTYVMTNASSQLVLNCPGGAPTNGLQIVQASLPAGTASQWVLTYAGNGYYTVQNVASGLYLTGNAAQGGALVQQPANGQTTQLWRPIQSGGGYVLVNEATGFDINDPGASSSPGTGMIMYQQDASVNSVWMLQATSSAQIVQNGTYTLTNVGAGTVMDDPGSSLTSGGTIVGQTVDGGNDEKWVFTYKGNGYYTIQNLASGLYLIPAGKVASFYYPSLLQETATGTDWELWSISISGRGYCFSNKYTTDMISGAATPGVVENMDIFQPGDRYLWTIQ